MSSLRELVLVAAVGLALAVPNIQSASGMYKYSKDSGSHREQLDEQLLESEANDPQGKVPDYLPNGVLEDDLLFTPSYDETVGRYNLRLEHATRTTLGVINDYQINYVINEETGMLTVYSVPEEMVMTCTSHEKYFNSVGEIAVKMCEYKEKVLAHHDGTVDINSELTENEKKFFILFAKFTTYADALLPAMKLYDQECGLNWLDDVE